MRRGTKLVHLLEEYHRLKVNDRVKDVLGRGVNKLKVQARTHHLNLVHVWNTNAEGIIAGISLVGSVAGCDCLLLPDGSLHQRVRRGRDEVGLSSPIAP